jgi:hypothetical protein
MSREGHDKDQMGEGMQQLQENNTNRANRHFDYGDTDPRLATGTSNYEKHLDRIRHRLSVEGPDDIRLRMKDEQRFWLVSRLIANDAYGVFAAESKAGKTWAGMDLALAVANGGTWLGKFECVQGSVMYFCGEGSPGNTLRRHDAICDFYGYATDCEIAYAHRVPHFGDLDHLTILHETISKRRPALVVIDPAYLAARGANHTSIFDTGAVLENVQECVQSAGAALCVVHHWNRGGRGKGQDRMSGAGWDAWGRFLINMSRGKPTADPATGKSSAQLEFTASGGEVSVEDWCLFREIWADDQDDINSALHYSVRPLVPTSERDSVAWLMAKVSQHLASVGTAVTPTSLRKAPLGRSGKGPASQTLSFAIKHLIEEGFVRKLPDGKIEHANPFS